ncbi:MAG: hypothetical protein LBJ14_03220 [Desulfarculales bacterium]|jgi:glycosyltransferase involved in cell wall biosynthesis|nr:hypothetical protein [Desulfarculales bacterium]
MTSSVLVTTYHQAFLHKGGGEYELLEIAFNLRLMGVVADVYSPFSRDIDAYDTVIHFSLMPDSLPFLRKARQLKKRVVLWPNFWQAEALAPDQIETFTRFFELCDAIIFKSETEEALLRQLIPDDRPVLRVPAGVDPCFTEPTPERLFRDSYCMEEYLLWVGIIEPAKNQLAAIRSLAHLSVPIVFVGNTRDADYYEACRKAAPPHFLFLPPMLHKSDILRAALRECRLYIESGGEPGGKSVLEAVISGAQVVIPYSAWAVEHFSDFPVYITSQEDRAIADAVSIAMKKKWRPDIAATVASRHMLPDVLVPLCNYIRETC